MSDEQAPDESGWVVARKGEGSAYEEPPVAAEITIRLYSLKPGDAQITLSLGDAIAPEGTADPAVVDQVWQRAAAELAEASTFLRG
ncbi:hypothetical protein SAMN06264364_107132 [Quadrisphaera granulorum]|uniref:Uncharacterized protein n=1 Tax=Quadrisphaera granulorum TaxID=317664 RepID=A0A316A943_9ACTN|nr:hypothetical protein BXY45_107132 [Quadrisphaera granulorum]SZE96208.1 hypothetical protein SAMN06264364_107132 [Quadrisphaera granulorum]